MRSKTGRKSESEVREMIRGFLRSIRLGGFFVLFFLFCLNRAWAEGDFDAIANENLAVVMTLQVYVNPSDGRALEGTTKDVPVHWNVNTNVWNRHQVYDPITQQTIWRWDDISQVPYFQKLTSWIYTPTDPIYVRGLPITLPDDEFVLEKDGDDVIIINSSGLTRSVQSPLIGSGSGNNHQNIVVNSNVFFKEEGDVPVLTVQGDDWGITDNFLYNTRTYNGALRLVDQSGRTSIKENIGTLATLSDGGIHLEVLTGDEAPWVPEMPSGAILPLLAVLGVGLIVFKKKFVAITNRKK